MNNKLSYHFTYAEMTHTSTGLPNDLDKNSVTYSKLKALCKILEYCRGVLGKPIIINSAYRSPEVNKAVGGHPRSRHMEGTACDICVYRYDDRDKETLERVLRSYVPCEFIKYDTFWHVAYDISRLGFRSGNVKTWQMEYPDLLCDTPFIKDF